MAGLAAVASLAACGSEGASSGSKTAPPSTSVSPTSSSPAASQLTVKVQPSAKAPAKTWVVRCDPPGGDHPEAKGACDALAKAGPGVFKPTPKDQACTMIYGGPEVATVTGVWRGQQVDSKFTRLNGCEISRWEKATPLLGKGPVPA